MIPHALRAVVLLVCLAALAPDVVAQKATASLARGTVTLESVGPIAFGPEQTLFVSDPVAAKLYAIDVKGLPGSGIEKGASVAKLDQKLAARLGAAARDIRVIDLAVNPVTHQVVLAVHRGAGADGDSVLLSVDGNGEIREVSLKNVAYTMAELTNAPPAPDRAGRVQVQRRSPRLQTFTDLAYVDGQVIVAGLSNEEFASKLRAIAYPFKHSDAGASVEIYHGAHGRFETNSPVRTFVPFDIEGEPHLLAAYTCTPLVSLRVADLVPGKKVRGKTIAELGNRNSPIDMVAYEKGGERYLLIANTSRGIMKVSLSALTQVEPVTTRVEGGATAGVPYETVAELQGVEQLDQLDAGHAVILVRTESGEQQLQVIALP